MHKLSAYILFCIFQVSIRAHRDCADQHVAAAAKMLSRNAGGEGGDGGGSGGGERQGETGGWQWYALLGLVPFESQCDLGASGVSESADMWPLCAGVGELMLQQTILHLLCGMARTSRHMQLRAAEAASAAADASSAAAAVAAGGCLEGSVGIRCDEESGDEEEAEMLSRIMLCRIGADVAGIGGVLLLFVIGLSKADVKHSAFLAFAVALCAVSDVGATSERGIARAKATKTRTWVQATCYVALVIGLDFMWHLGAPDGLLPPVPLLGLGGSGGDPLWFWSVLGAEVLVYVLLTQFQLQRLRAQTLSGELDERRRTRRLAGVVCGWLGGREAGAGGGSAVEEHAGPVEGRGGGGGGVKEVGWKEMRWVMLQLKTGWNRLRYADVC